MADDSERIALLSRARSMMLCSGQFLAMHCSTQRSVLMAHTSMAIDKCIIAGRGRPVAQDLTNNIMEPTDVLARMQT